MKTGMCSDDEKTGEHGHLYTNETVLKQIFPLLPLEEVNTANILLLELILQAHGGQKSICGIFLNQSLPYFSRYVFKIQRRVAQW